MEKASLIQNIGMIASFIVPFFNLPLIIRIIKRKSANDVSLLWVLGVFVCFVLMAPSGFTSDDAVYRTFTIMNLAAFSGVTFTVLYFRVFKK